MKNAILDAVPYLIRLFVLGAVLFYMDRTDAPGWAMVLAGLIVGGWR